MEHYKLRFTYHDFCDKKAICDFILKLKPIKYCLSEEIGEKTKKQHIQAYVVFSQQKNWLNTKMRSFCKSIDPEYTAPKGRQNKDNGNSRYATGIFKEEYPTLPTLYIGYCVKQDKNPITNFEPEFLEKCYQEWKLFEETKNVKKEVKAKTELEKVDALMQLEPWFKRDIVLPYQAITADQIIYFVVGYYKNEGKRVMEFHMRTLVQTLCLKYIPSYHNDLCKRIKDSIVPRETFFN